MLLGRHDVPVNDGGMIEIPARWCSDLFGGSGRVCVHLRRELKDIELIPLKEMSGSFSGLLREDGEQADVRIVPVVEGAYVSIPAEYLSALGIKDSITIIGEISHLRAGNPATIKYVAKDVDTVVRTVYGFN